MNFTDIFIQRPVLATVISLLILLAGLRSMQMLTVSEYPASESAVVTVSTTYVGAEAGLVQGFITTLLEREIASADGIDYLESSSFYGSSLITAHLQLNYDPYDALTQITSKVNRVRDELPPESEEPVINVAIGEATAAMYLNFASDTRPANKVTDYLIRLVQPKIEAVPGIQQAAMLGARNFAMRIWLDPLRMAALNISPSDVRNALKNNNFQAAAGKTKGEAIAVNLTADTDLQTAEEFRRLVVAEQDGVIIRLGDIASVVLGAEDYDRSTAYTGKPATTMAINVLPNANILKVIREVRELFPEIQRQLPPDLTGSISYDRTLYIDDSINEVVTTLIEAVVIVTLVIYLFLGSVRSVIIPIVAIPLSLIGAGTIMLVLGYSLNLLTLLALVLAIGLVVDDAIIVVENIQRHIEKGVTPLKAAIIGARELATPVIAMTITLIAVYAPIGFSGGLTGSLFREFVFTLAGAVIISGVVALTLSPMMCSRTLTPYDSEGRFALFLNAQFTRLRRAYERRLHNSLDYIPVTLVFAVAILVSIYFMFQFIDSELAPVEDQGVVLVRSTANANTSPEQLTRYTAALTKSYEDFFEDSEQNFLYNGVFGNVSETPRNFALSGLVLKPWSERSRTQMALQPLVQERIDQIAGLQSVAFPLPTLPGAGFGLPVQFVIGSTDPPSAVYAVAQEMLARAQASGLFAFADIDLKYDRPEVEIKIDRDKAATLGIDMEQLGRDLGTMLSGNYVNRFSMQGRSYKVIPQVQRRYRLNPDQLGQFQVSTRSGELVPLSSLVAFEQTVKPRQLNRFQQLNSAMLSGVPMPGVPVGTAIEFLQQQGKEVFPQGYSADYAGASRQYIEEGSGFVFTFFFAVIIIYLVLAAQFESFRDPLIMLVSVPMSIAGAMVFLTLGLASVNIFTQVALITLVGLISKHGILIVQFANQLQQQEGLTKRAAIEKASGIRLRPIVMTTGAMVFSVVPLITASGAGAVSRSHLGLVIASGMSIGTLFTIFVVPAMYVVLAKQHGVATVGSAK